MKKLFLAILGAGMLTGLGIAHADDMSAAQQSFATLDQAFVKQYSKQSHLIGQKMYPVIVVTGFDYELHLADGSVKKFNGLVSPFNELKAVSHIGPALYAILSPAWMQPNDTTWQQNLRDFQGSVKAALAQVDAVDWSNAGWPNQGEQVKSFMRDSLQMVDNFITQALKKNKLTLADYQTFAQHYMHTMLATMYLADVANTTTVLKNLMQWKKEMGDAEWNKLYVLVLGSKGRTTSELTVDTSTVGLTVKGLMTPENAKTHIVIMPMASTLSDALNSLGAVVNANGLAEATFVTQRSKDATGVYKALKTANIPLAQTNVSHIVHQDVNEGQVNLPKLQILDKDKGAY